MAQHDLLVASAGGHLTQLHLLATRLVPQRPRIWVTYDHPQSASLLADEQVVHGAGPSSRSVSAAIRNWWLAGRVLDPDRVARVVSTGSAIAVPFLVRADRRGIEGHYVESATRASGPSLSGRLLERLTNEVGLHTQHASWAGGRWQAVSSVLEGFEAVPGTPADGPLRIVVSLGTHHFPFDRLLAWLAPALRDDDELLVQHGATEPPADLRGHVRTVHSLPASELDEELRAADVVVGHAGTGLALSTMVAGNVPVLLARDADRGEHVDDHQHQTLEFLRGRDLAFTAPRALDRRLLVTAAATRVELGREDRPLLLSC